ncbi:MAG: CAP domain-containing protein [Candidatus Cloacimonetes bacterium HGW-Cloacimonetes-3]|jgi:hypothetical protein|nr:MAG: CAP domain-containing protein [Candidatus Cloacimonetes bacterium HGW-Cloacimonetes-3]
MSIKRLLLLILLISVTALSAVQITITEFEHLIWRITNAERAKNNMAPLVYDDGLADLSRQHSRNMLGFGFFDHKDQLGNYVNDRKRLHYPELIVSSIGENLARFYNTDGIYTPQEIVTGWMNSSEHRKNILNEGYTHLGVGVVIHEGFLLATQNFATPLVKLSTPIPKKIKRKKGLSLDFEYLSPISPDKLNISLSFPNPKLRYQVSKNSFTVGSMPVQITWIDPAHFRLELDFLAGKGLYELSFGFGGGFYKDGVKLKVK